VSVAGLTPLPLGIQDATIAILSAVAANTISKIDDPRWPTSPTGPEHQLPSKRVCHGDDFQGEAAATNNATDGADQCGQDSPRLATIEAISWPSCEFR
jgi:hypothetical protein